MTNKNTQDGAAQATPSFQGQARTLLGSLDDSARRSIGRRAAYETLRVTAARTDLVMLGERLGAQAPQVVAALGRLQRAERAASLAQATRRAAETGAGLGPDQAALVGQVSGPGGLPLAGVKVVWTDERGPAEARLKDGRTDGAGWYALQVPVTRAESFFADSKQVVVEVSGGPFELEHTVILPVGGPSARGARVRKLDIHVPAEAFPAGGPAVSRGGAGAPGGSGALSAQSLRATASDSAPPPAASAPPAPADKVYLASGAEGGLVRRVQTRLGELGFDPKGVDGRFGAKTAGAVEAFQRDRSLEASGEVDGATWRGLFESDPPPPFERALQVTASFEGHGFTLAEGNWDGAGLTWGIIGFTLRHGEVGKIVQTLQASHPEILVEDFGPQRSKTLLQAVSLPAAERVAWADSISIKSDKRRLYKPWTEAFERFGSRPEVQALQLQLAAEDYGKPAARTAAELGLTSELGLALALDAQVQDGGVSAAARQQIEQEGAGGAPGGELELRRRVARAVADHARPEFRGDVLARKLTLAEGEGTVHGRHYELRNWGLDETVA